MKSFFTKAALNLGIGHDKVKTELKTQIDAQFLDIGVKLLKAKAAIAKEPALKGLLTTCNKLQIQADVLQRFLLEKAQFNDLSQMLIIYGQKNGFEELKPKLSTSPAVQELKTLLQSLLSVEIYNSLIPLAEQMGSFDKLQLKEQQNIVEILKSEKAITKVKDLNLSTTFSALKKNMATLAREFNLEPNHHANLITMVDKIEKTHLDKLTDIKKEVEQYLPQLQEKLLDIIYTACPELKIAKEKPKEIVVHQEEKKKRKKTESKEEVAKKAKKQVVRKI